MNVADGKWHYVCVTWDGQSSHVKMYLDGIYKAGIAAKHFQVIAKDGFLVIGQEQDSFGGGFDKNQNFIGELTAVNIWNRVLSEEEISTNARQCHVTSVSGDAISWVDFTQGELNGQAAFVPSSCFGMNGKSKC